MQITREELREKYSSMKNDDLCDELGITRPTLVKYLNDVGIPLKGKGNRMPKKKINVI